MTLGRLAAALVPSVLLLAAFGLRASAQPMLYAQRLPPGTVYIRLASALPDAATVATPFAGLVALGDDGASRLSPYFVAGSVGGTTVAVKVTEGASTATASFKPKSGAFVTVVLSRQGNAVTARVITDAPDYNQLKARLTYYNATPDCPDAALAEADGRTVFQAMPPGTVQARSINPVAATVVASCGQAKAPPLNLGSLQQGGLYSVFLIRPDGQLSVFMAKDLIAPPRL